MPALSRCRALLVEFEHQEERLLGQALADHGICVAEGTLGRALEPELQSPPFDLVMVSSSDIAPDDLAPAVIRIRLAHPGAILLLISGTLPRPDLMAMSFVKVDAIVHRPFRTHLVMALVEALLGEKGDAFKSCPSCHQIWEDRDAFLADKDIDLLGLQANFVHPSDGYLLFNHIKDGCHTTLALPVSHFLDFYIGPTFHQNAYATADCSGHCLEVGSLAPCPADCTHRTAREVMLALLSHFRRGQGA